VTSSRSRSDGSVSVVVSTVVLATGLFARTTAVGATNRIIFESLLFVESLFAFGERELVSTIPANDHFVWHVRVPPKNVGFGLKTGAFQFITGDTLHGQWMRSDNNLSVSAIISHGLSGIQEAFFVSLHIIESSSPPVL
jgi:hypothetical protein